ncbi:MAG: MotA/TolQ/ExbB proton channel family protein, partial [Verrucomicrobiaceae bacterium]
MEFLHNALYVLSNALLIPTLAAIVGLAAWIAVALGGVAREWLGRREVRETLRALRRIANDGPEGQRAALLRLRTCRTGLPARFGRQFSEWPDARELAKGLEDLELDVTASLSKLAWVTRI